MTPSRISQADGARLMAAAEAWVDACAEYQTNPVKSQDARLRLELQQAERAFAELLSKLTEGD